MTFSYEQTTVPSPDFISIRTASNEENNKEIINFLRETANNIENGSETDLEEVYNFLRIKKYKINIPHSNYNVLKYLSLGWWIYEFCS
ncbi:MAG: hypothetical protein JKX76_01630 [Colwellia sp.]|nr:hypothetical protein [Colwellia sp.]